MPKYYCFTDGSCLTGKCKDPLGVAFIIFNEKNETVFEYVEHIPKSAKNTNNIAELQAVKKLLIHILSLNDENNHFIIYSDSELCINICNFITFPKKSSKHRPFAYALIDLRKRLINKPKFILIKSKENKADRLAKKAAGNFID